MSSSKDFVNLILQQSESLTSRAMMGDYVIYYNGKVIGGIYDNRLLIKPVAAAKALLLDAELISPYKGAKEMLFVDKTDNKEFMEKLFGTLFKELPDKKKVK